ncbi:PREDICTED: multidrug resistance-associated protein 4-like [Vollenhovia emeryi]|uniref:multidrug resistance-associated protein 4-like n=1 Tax=Vollenhovia emeryi TaxID=411798 RepID=UPI0005F381F5|nr:PREDICTED: multidrug resistance-associated protein 4-like [Vollenhovia emeryi]
MDSSKVRSNPNPREKANIVSVLLWWWTISLFKTGYKKALEVDDLFDPLKVDRSKSLGDRLEKRWNIELENSKKWKRSPSLLRAIFRTFLLEYSMLGLVQIFNEFVIRLGTPLLLGGLLRYFRKGSDETYESAVWFAVGICIATGLYVISGNQTIFGAFHVGAKVRVSVCSLVYRKALRLSKTALGETAPGKVVNLVANDVSRFDLVTIFIHHMWSAPLSALIVAYILYQEVGYPGLIGIAAIFVVVPLQSYTGKLSSKFRLQTAIKTDERVRLMDEIISGVQVIKMYAWEKPFCAMVELARKLELRVVTKSSYIRGIYMTFNLFTTRMGLFCTLVSMLVFGNELTAAKIFVVSSYFNILAHTMTGMFVRGFAELAECMVAIRRLQTFLIYNEFQGSNVIFSRASSGNNSDFKQAPKQDLPYIDDDVVENQLGSHGEDSEHRKQNGLLIVASDLLKNTANFVGENKQSMYDTNNWAINMINVNAKWEERQSENTLENLNLEIEKGKLYAVIGMVGSGKSTFLSAILGEISLTGGQVKVNGDISYASQEAWVFGATVRQNILFGQTYERQRYQKVVKACALVRDFKQFPQGDQTIVGERGSSLSGGQKARINLARALYRQSDIYLMDDPLSAVDAHVSKHLFQECMQKYLAGKTRILATHQLQYIKGVDAIILLEQGKMQYFSHYQDLLEYRPEYGVLLATENEVVDDSSLESSINLRRQFSSTSNRSRTPEASSGGTDDEEEDEDSEKLNDGLEGTSRGMVKGPIFIKFFKMGANLYMAFTVLLLFIITQFIVSLNDLFVPFLINFVEAQDYEFTQVNLNQTDDSYTNTTGLHQYLAMEDARVIHYVYIYAGIVLAIFFVGITRSLVFYKTCMTCSQRLHDMMFSALIRTGMRFFDTNASGRILNRFSKDMGAIDELLPKAMLDAGQMNMMMLGSLTVTCVVNPIFLAPIVVIGGIFYWIRRIYLKTSKNIKRLEGISRSPVFTHLNATLNGLTTIRAYCAQDILKHEFDKLQDVHTSTVYMYIVTSTAFGFFLDMFCFLFTSLVTFSFLLLKQSFTGGEVGLAITQVMAMTGIIQWGMRQSAEVANQMMAVERVLEYVQLPEEPNLRDRGAYVKKKDKNAALPCNAPKDWPDQGCITFKEVNMRYAAEDALVLRDLNIIIHPGEKVGIVGRTGAGKSSLISALFRLAKVEGTILIDNADTGLMALEDLRRKISIIPQDPVLFSGTLRRNLDPFNEFPDTDLWEALEEVELKEAVITLGNGLESRVFDRGSNYSVGQRQLVCLARAILRNNRILMLDEATANVDPHTDALIQRTIRKKFATCTMLTVAHRLNTIMDSDKVLVMDKGRMAEYDHPHILLKNSYSQFTSLVKETGPGMYDQLAKVARQAYFNKYGET